MAGEIRSFRYALWDTASVTDGGFGVAASTNIGPIAPGGSTIPADAEVLSEEVSTGSAQVGANIEIVLRILGATPTAALVTAKDANPPTEGYLFVTNLAGDAYTQYGPGTISHCAVSGESTERGRQSFTVRFVARGDTPEDILKRYVATVTLP